MTLADRVILAAGEANLNATTYRVVAGAADAIDRTESVGESLDRARSVALAYLSGVAQTVEAVSALSEFALALRVIDRALR